MEQRLSSWTTDIEKLQEGLTEELRRLEGRQRQLMAEIESRIGKDAEGLQGQIEEQRQLIARQREELTRVTQGLVEQANADLEHAAEPRRALQEIADRLRRRETELKEVIDRESSDAAVRVQSAFGDVERRQVEQLQRVVARETQRYTEAASQTFDTTIRSAREDAARRLSRELDLAVERFARQAEGVLTERVNAVTEAAGKRIEERIARTRGAVERQRDEALQALEDQRTSSSPDCVTDCTRSPTMPSRNAVFSSRACTSCKGDSTNWLRGSRPNDSAAPSPSAQLSWAGFV